MIFLTDIHDDRDNLYAHALDMRTHAEVDISVCKVGDSFCISSGETFGDFVKACGVLQSLGKKSKKLPKEYEINWGM
jgi:hypothetical protein